MTRHEPKPAALDVLLTVACWACAIVGFVAFLLWLYAQPWAEPLRH